MSLPQLGDLSKLNISKTQGPVPTDGLWTSRSPTLLPPSPIPGQHDDSISTDSSSPIFPRWEFGLCANERGDVYFYGGETKGQRDELYHYLIKDNAVTPLRCSGTSPGRRDCHAMTLAGNVIALHGGYEPNDGNLYLLNLDSREWSRITTSGDAPGRLRYHSMAAIGMTIYIFGGYDSNMYYNDLWAFDLNTLNGGEPRWELINPSSQAKPAARNAPTLLTYRGQLILFGGNSGVNTYYNDVWSFDPKSRMWNELQCTGNTPTPRYRHTAAMLNDVMYIASGYNGTSPRLNDICALKMSDRRWFKLTITATTPVARDSAASACIGTQIFIFGGDVGGKSEEHPIHILDANYINNPDLHAPEQLKEINIKFQVMLSRGKLGSDSPETETSKRSQIISHILEYPSKMDSLTQLQKADAQMIVDFLADELSHQDIIESNTHKRHILHFLGKLAKSAQVFPKSTELSDVQCVLTTPVNDEGGYGFIYKGVFRNQTVCVKAVRVNVSGPSTAKRLRRGKKLQTGETSQGDKKLRAQVGETVLLSLISHPNVIPLYGTYLSNEELPRICIVSPWMENGDLSAYLRKFPNTPIIPFASDMAAGLGFLHDMGIIHADIKAANVLVSQSQRALLADFGIATVLHTVVGGTTAADYSGTTWWMAPELLISTANHKPPPPTKESDMWAFACVCYEMFAGDFPFFDREFTPVHVMMAFVAGRKITPLRPNEESDLIDVDGDPISVDDEPWIPLAEKCWSYEPSERPTAAEALQFLAGLNVRDERPSMDEELATFKAIRDSMMKVDIDYDHVLSIVRNETTALKRSQIISHLLEYPSKMESLVQLQTADAQMIVDLLADELGRREIVQSNAHTQSIFHFLTKLVKTAQVFPKSTELSDVQCALTAPVNNQGGYGFVYKGDFTGQVVCVKAVHVTGSGPTASKRSWRSKQLQTGEMLQGGKKLWAQVRETVLLAHVSHPNVLPLYGAYLSNEDVPRVCIVSPWMENGDLAAYLEKYPNTPMIPLASDMAAGLGFLHDMGVIHGDLKAANVLVSRSQRAILADFGIATVLHTIVGRMTAGDYAGVTCWMAPELLIAAGTHNPPPSTKESDMWAFACVCYEMFTGGIPFADHCLTAIYLTKAFTAGRRITPLRPNEESDPIDINGDHITISDEPWVPLAERCWSYDPSERPTATEALQFLSELNVRDERPSMDEELATFKAIKDSMAKVETDYGQVLLIIQNT